MPAKKKVEAAAEESEKKPAVKRTRKATTAKKTTTAAKKPATEKKTTAAKKTSTRTRKTTKKAETPVAAPVVKEKPADYKTVKDYVDIINWKKGEAHAMDWLYIEVNAGDLLTEVEAGKDNLDTVCDAIREAMLEGDAFIVEPEDGAKVSDKLTVRYYCDNLSPERKKYSEVL